MSRKIDDIVRQLGISSNVDNSPSLSSTDDLSATHSFYDYVLNAIDLHDKELRKKFTNLEFLGIVLHVREITSREIASRTSVAFANSLLPPDNTSISKAYEVFVHVPEISGILPQPSVAEVNRYRGYQQLYASLSPENIPEQAIAIMNKHERLCSRFPKFYLAGNNIQKPNYFDIHKVKFPDKGFFYYGQLGEVFGSAEQRLAKFNIPAAAERSYTV